MESLASLLRKSWFGVGPVEEDCFLEAVKVRHAVGTAIKMTPDFPALRGVYSLVQVITDMIEDFLTPHGLVLHDVMYSFNCSLRKIRARRKRDFTAGTESFKILAVSSADWPSISRKTNTVR